VRDWCALRGRPVGALLTLEQGWALAQAWFTDPRRSGWRRKPLAAMAALIRAQGLDGPFWALVDQGET
jgi:hypothetical protein